MKNLLRLFEHLKPYSGKLVLSVLFLLMSTGIMLLQPNLTQVAVDRGILSENIRFILLTAAAFIVLGAIASMAGFTSGRFLILSAQGMSYDLRNELYKKVSSFSFSNFDAWRTGELMVRMNSDVNMIRMFVRMGILMLFQSLFMIIGAIIGMYLTDTRLATYMAALMLGTLLLFFIIARFVRPLFVKVREALDRLNNVLQENLAGAKLIRAFSREEEEKQKFAEKNNEFYAVSLKVGIIIGVLMPLLMLIGNLALLTATWIGGIHVGQGFLRHGQTTGLTLGQLLAFNSYAMLAVFPILMLAMVLNFMAMASASAKRICELLAEKPALGEKPNALDRPGLPGRLEFKNVSFHYGNGECAVQNIELALEPGERIGIIGTTGSGKSTLANLAARYYDVTDGSVLLDGSDVRDLTLRSVRTCVAVALQETVLFTGSIIDNIRFGRPEASQEEIYEAARAACAEEFILEKDNTWDEEVGTRGMNLSGGQRQRVAVARALLAKPGVLVLDDVTSALDMETESRLVKNIYNQARNSTVIIISQKVNAVRRADRIYVMDRGRIMGSGTHEELLQTSELYREIERTQSAHI